jgi:hypothetical protein
LTWCWWQRCSECVGGCVGNSTGYLDLDLDHEIWRSQRSTFLDKQS